MNIYIGVDYSVYPPEYAELQQTNQKINQGPTDKTFQDSNYLPQGPCYASTDLMEQSFNKTNVSLHFHFIFKFLI